MTRRGASDTLARVLGIAGLIALSVSAITTLEPSLAATDAAPGYPLPGDVRAPDRRIQHEADVFRTRSESLAVAADVKPRREAQRRALTIYRSLRAFPGAPPRVPHGLTQDEYRETQCASCHLRGGYVARFGGYAPVTPHPEFSECLQCHVPDAARVGIGLPAPADPVACGQCHVAPGIRQMEFVELDWRPLEWVRPSTPALLGAPPPIPHSLELRGNCLACHGGPGAVAEVRTTHPERSNCRQCHVTAPLESGEFDRAGATSR
jgi:cytochrome c-type protein NapB